MKTLGTKKENKYLLDSLGQTFELTLDPKDETKIISFKMLDDKKQNPTGIVL